MLGPLGHVGSALAYFATARRQHKSDLLTAQQLASPLPLPRGLELTWIGTAGFRLAYQGTVMWIDPYVTRLPLIDLVRRMPEVVECHTVAGDFDFLLKIAVKDVADYRRLLWSEFERIGEIKTLRSTILLDSPKMQVSALP